MPRRGALSLSALPVRHPVTAALQRYTSAVGARSMQSRLNVAARMMSVDREHPRGQCDAFTLPWDEVDAVHVSGLRQALLDLGRSPGTVNTTLSGIRAVLREGVELGIVNPAAFARVLRIPRVRFTTEPAAGRMLSAAELVSLQQGCRRGGDAGARDLAALALLYGCGLRLAETIGTLRADLRFDLRPWAVRVVGKGEKERLQPLTRPVAELLRPWLRRRGDAPGPLLYPFSGHGRPLARSLSASGLRSALARRQREAGLARFTPHDLRRSFVSHLLDRGVSLREVQKLAGHAQVATTEKYDRRVLRGLSRAAARLPL